MPPPDRHGFELALLALLFVAAVLSVAKYQADDMREELACERSRRDALEERLRKREQQLDGALSRINELSPADE